jgi:hypothetical protein
MRAHGLFAGDPLALGIYEHGLSFSDFAAFATRMGNPSCSQMK